MNIKIKYLFKSIFLGILTWIYISTVNSLCIKSNGWLIFSIFSYTLLVTFLSDIIKVNKNEFGKYTYAVGVGIIMLIFMVFLLTIGMFQVVLPIRKTA